MARTTGMIKKISVDIMEVMSSRVANKVSDVLCALFNGYCPSDDSLLEKLRTWLETSVNTAGNMSLFRNKADTSKIQTSKK